MSEAINRPVYRIVALDMDGTLLNSAKQITPYTRQALRRAANAGAVISLSTGRCLSELERFLAEIPDIGYVIGESGACVLDIKKDFVIQKFVFGDDEVETIFKGIEGIDCFIQCFINGRSHISSISETVLRRCRMLHFLDEYRLSSVVEPDIHTACRERGTGVGKINLFFRDEAGKARFMDRIRGLDVALSDSMGIGAEISPRQATKASGLRALCRYLDIPLEQTMAVGDSANDVDILRIAGLPVVMGNTPKDVRALARYITDDCDHDGVAHAIERFIL